MMAFKALDKAAPLVLYFALLTSSCSSESDPYDAGDDPYSAPYRSANTYEYYDGAMGQPDEEDSRGGRSDFWGGVNIMDEAAKIGERLRSLANEELDIASFQAVYDSRTYSDDASSQEKASQIAHRLYLKLQAYEEVVASNRKLVEGLLSRRKSTVPDDDGYTQGDCCLLNSSHLHDDLRYATPVATETSCNLRGARPSAWDGLVPRADLTEAFRRNAQRMPGIKWQYFISLKSHAHCEYPAHSFPHHADGSCQALVYHRHRDSILATLRRQLKITVIVIDNGCSLSDNQMSSALAVADLLVESHNEKDTVAVLTVANDVTYLSTLGICAHPAHEATDRVTAEADKPLSLHDDSGRAAANYFLHPTSDVKQHLRVNMRTVTQDSSMTNHTLAFVKAFDLLRTLLADGSSTIDGEDVSIAYISRGLMSTLADARQVLAAIFAGNAQLGARVRIDAYALVDNGKPLMYEGIFLKDIAAQNVSKYEPGRDTAMPNPPRGRLVNVTSSSDLRAVVDTMLLPGVRMSAEDVERAARPYHSPLHVDAADRTPVITLMMPCLDQQNIAFGVVGADLHQSDLAEDVLHFESSALHYSFIVSLTGQALAHPLLVKTRGDSGGGSGDQHRFINTDIRLLEAIPGFSTVFNNILSSPNGTAAVHTTDCLSDGAAPCQHTTGDSSGDGMKQYVHSYSWQRVNRSSFIVVVKQILTASQAASKKLYSDPIRAHSASAAVLGADAVVYHRLDLLPTENTCNYFGQLATFDASTFFLSPKAFHNSYDHIHKMETKSSVQNYMAFLRDTSGLISNPGIKEEARYDVGITAAQHKFWLTKARKSRNNGYIARRYVATPRGVMRTYPGTMLAKTLEPTTAPWYVKAMASPGRLTLVAPPRGSGDGSGAGYLASLSQTVYEGRTLIMHTPSDPVAAVVGLDLSAQYLYKWLLEAMPQACDVGASMRCFLIDDSGYVISHPYLTKVPVGIGPVEQNHITHMEPLIAADLIAHKDFATKRLCNNMADRTMQRYYVFNTSMQGIKQNIKIGEACVKYQITAVPRTNAFLVMVNDTCLSTMPAFCPCSTSDRLCLLCDRAEQGECECPCECQGRSSRLYDMQCGGHITAANKDSNATNSSSAAVGRQHLSTSATEEDRNLNCWLIVGDGWDNVPSLLLPALLMRTLPTCSAVPVCDNHTSASSCLGILGCEWCFEESAGADRTQRVPLSQPYCALRHHCAGGIFRVESLNDDQEFTVSATGNEPQRSGATPVGPVAGAVMGTFLLVALGVYCYRHYTSRRRQAGQECRGAAAAGVAPDVCLPLTEGLHDSDREPDAHGCAPVAQAAAANGHVNLLLLIDQVANVSPYRMNANYRRPHYAVGTTTESSDRGYSSLTQADDMDSSSVVTVPSRARARSADQSPIGSTSSLLGGADNGTLLSTYLEATNAGALESLPLLPSIPPAATSSRHCRESGNAVCRQPQRRQQQQRSNGKATVTDSSCPRWQYTRLPSASQSAASTRVSKEPMDYAAPAATPLLQFDHEEKAPTCRQEAIRELP